MKANSAKESFVRELCKTLAHLYDPGVLRHSPLVQLFGINQQASAMSALQHIFTKAIEALKPDESVPVGANAWRLYHILYYRYVEQFTQREVATDLSLSVRQLRRQEKVAVQVLADYLWTGYDLGRRARALDSSSETGDRVGSRSSSANMVTPSREEELAWLEKTVPSEAADLQELFQATLETVRPLVQTLNVAVACNVPDNLPAVTLQTTTMRQALLHIITTAAHYIPGGRVDLSATVLPPQAGVQIQVIARRTVSGAVDKEKGESLEIARKLVQLSGGSFEVTVDTRTETPFSASIILPTPEQVTVLVVDDNADTLKLLQRYLSGTRYRFLGATDPQAALVLAQKSPPDIIVMDVMLPEIDGWELLGRLREHPNTCHVPVVVCTILPQEQLALTLGAAEFIRKPVTRKLLLATLNRQIGQKLREADQSS